MGLGQGKLPGAAAKKDKGSFAYETGIGALYAYLDAKKATGDPEEIQRVDTLYAELECSGILRSDKTSGGALQLSAEDVSLSEAEFAAAQKLFDSRHSVRDYADSDVDHTLILEAVELENRCPSACNRQPYHVYVTDAKDRAQLGFACLRYWQQHYEKRFDQGKQL